MKSINQIEKEIIDEFEMFESWMQKYEYLIDLGKELPAMPSEHQIEENLIKGCQSKVWLNAEFTDSKIIFSAQSDAIMTKGIIALLIRVLSNQKPSDILNAELSFIDKIGLKEQLSPVRANGLLSMVKQMKIYAVALNN
tara:strand:+ start:1459 stop:1875 length:417 start_codon:yes stop_codon:yes gene_type:complete